MYGNHQNKDMYCFVLMLLLIIPPSYQRDERQLLDHLLQNYTPFARPVHDINKAVVVTFGFELVHIVSIVESDQTITAKVWIRMSWINELMKWDPSKWGGVTLSRLNQELVWTPDIFLQEDVSSDMSTGPEKYKTKITIGSNGTHRWLVPALLQSSCIFNVAHFPFDFQSCRLIFTSWTHDQKELDMKADASPIITKNYINSSEWDLTSVTKRVKSKYYGCCLNPFVDIRFTINLRRKPLYYVYSVVVPCIIQMLIILFTFFLPPDSGERIGVVITVLLVFAVYLEVLSSSLPKTSNSTPALSRFYIAAMAESACSLIATCIVLIIHFKGTEKGIGPMPNWIRIYFIDGMARFLYIRRNLREHSNEGLLALDKNGSYTGLDVDENHKMEDRLMLRDNASPVTMQTLVNEVRVITALINDQNRQDEIEEEWQILAKICDRIFFFVFLIIFVVSSLVLLLPIYYVDSTA